MKDASYPAPGGAGLRGVHHSGTGPTLAETIEQWWDGIETYLTTGITNAASEGNNRLIKLEARNAFGFRNRANQRLRSRCATTRRSRRQAHPH
ncbi:transposase [Streptomyces sp. SCSIO 30461]|uniref:transposase n=1 Tax=Streptomyces sp. SCSIO 30461 TaxID=3118085 RepID=UPI0030CC0BA0